MTDRKGGWWAMAKGYRIERCGCGEDIEVHDPECDSCGAAMTPVFDSPYPTTQYAGAMEISVGGGFGMFIDPMADGKPHRLICEECARRLLVQNPWLAEMP